MTSDVPTPENVAPGGRERDTAQRRAIRAVIELANRPLSPSEILEAAKPTTPSIGIATVYRNVKSLVAEGWLHPVELPGEPPRYEQTGKGHHHHFHCRLCGRVFEIHGCANDLQHLTPPGFSLGGHELYLFGKCADCVNASRMEPTQP